MSSIPIIGRIEGTGSFIAISVDTLGNFSVANSVAPLNAAMVPLRATVSGAGAAFTITLNQSGSYSFATENAGYDDGNVPVLGFAAGAATRIEINASTGVVTAGNSSISLSVLLYTSGITAANT